VHEVNWIALAVFLALFAFVTWLGFAAAHWRKGDLDLTAAQASRVELVVPTASSSWTMRAKATRARPGRFPRNAAIIRLKTVPHQRLENGDAPAQRGRAFWVCGDR